MICRPSEGMPTVQVIGPTKLGRSLAVLGGPAATPNAAQHIEGVDLLVHPAYSGSADSNSAHASTAGTAASQAGAKHLCITGVSQSCWQDTLHKRRYMKLKRPYVWSCGQHKELGDRLPSMCLARKPCRTIAGVLARCELCLAVSNPVMLVRRVSDSGHRDLAHPRELPR